MDTNVQVLVCPYFRYHKVSKQDFIKHVSKCAKSPYAPLLVTCKFNDFHRVDPEDLIRHESNCPDGRKEPVEVDAPPAKEDEEYSFKFSSPNKYEFKKDVPKTFADVGTCPDGPKPFTIHEIERRMKEMDMKTTSLPVCCQKLLIDLGIVEALRVIESPVFNSPTQSIKPLTAISPVTSESSKRKRLEELKEVLSTPPHNEKVSNWLFHTPTNTTPKTPMAEVPTATRPTSSCKKMKTEEPTTFPFIPLDSQGSPWMRRL